jgi:hypothetical protein
MMGPSQLSRISTHGTIDHVGVEDISKLYITKETPIHNTSKWPYHSLTKQPNMQVFHSECHCSILLAVLYKVKKTHLM